MNWEEYESKALQSFADAGTPEKLGEAHTGSLGRRSELKTALRNVRDRETGITLNAVRERLEQAFTAREEELERERLARLDEQLDVTLPGERLRRGRLHPLTQIRREVEDIFLGLGYEIIDSREVETVWHNFDALNQPLTHPSRSHRDTFYVDPETLLRTHTSTGQIRVMENRQPPIYIATLGRVYRRDTPSPRSTPNFHQVEALAVDRGITLADLKGTLMHFFRAMFGEGRDVRMRTSFFPFTEPSVEFDVTCFLCGGEGCAFCKHTGWFEMGGAGVVDPAVFENVGYDPEEWSGFAWGLGLDRIAAQRHGIPDIRMFWENDLRVLRQF
ncbi:MAG TPA: phenylalanine--tRNA ligase subunit alpha [Gaiellaceae bacterium]|jgi:phenylalanyl-tRNA synthetase alpha chain|nr:phenylalanine--tRNA ligase subunit alpha [Gaiellaceae bacterium]